MMMNIVVYLVVTWIATHFLLSILRRSRLSPKRFPPGPMPMPIIGNLHNLGPKPHQSLASLAKVYGPVISLRLGSLTTVVVSSVGAAREVLQKNDVAFSNRQVQDALTGNGHHQVSVVFMPPGPRWRNLRKICNSHVFSTSRLDASRELRKEKVQQLLSYVDGCCNAGTPVNIGLASFGASLNLLSNTFFSVDLADSSSDTSRELKELVWDIVKEVGKPNIVDFFPILRPLDPQGVRPRIMALVERIFAVFDRMIEPRMAVKDEGRFEDKDVLDALLSIAQETKNDEFTLKDIRHLLTDLFTAGTDTTSSTIEWAMAELLRNPEKLAKAQSELRQAISRADHMEESDISRLPYLQAVVKETLRMHPPTPLLIPRKVDADVELCGFTVPKNSQVFVNVWAMGRDPGIWERPEVFEPERFVASSVDYKGNSFELIPFGAGRRVCPGLMLAHRMIHLVIGSLLHGFDWKLADGMRPDEMDMDDKFGLTLQKAESLRVVPIRVVDGY